MYPTLDEAAVTAPTTETSLLPPPLIPTSVSQNAQSAPSPAPSAAAPAVTRVPITTCKCLFKAICRRIEWISVL